MQNQTFKLSLKPNDYPPNLPFVYADQYDVGRTFVATVYDADGTLYNFTTETVTVVGTKPSGTGFSYTATASGNTVTFETTGQMTVVAGNVTCGIIIEKDGDRIGTLHFILHIQPAALSSDTIIDSDDFGSIISAAVAEYMEEHGIVIDDTLSVAGAAADAKKTGDEIADLKSAIDLGSITPEVKTALLACFENVAWINDDGQDYVDALHDALYNRYWEVTNTLTNCTTSNESVQTIKGAAYTATITASAGYVMTGATVSITMGGNDITATAYSNGVISIPAVTGALVITISAAAKPVSSISAVYTQSGTVYDTDSLDSLKSDLVVTATYSDSSTAVVPAADYTLSGTLTEGTSTVTVSYGGKTDTFTVTVTAVHVPTGYTEYDYLYSNATGQKVGSYIATLVSFSNPTTAEYTVVFQEVSGNDNTSHIIGTREKNTGSTNNVGFDLVIASSHISIGAWSGTPGANTTLPTAFAKYTAIATWTASEITTQIDDATPVVATHATRNIGGYPICLFGVKHAVSAHDGTEYFFRGKIYYAEAKQDGVTIMKCYPCVRDSDGTAGMYDAINNAFYTPYSTGAGYEVVAGNDA